MLYFPLEDSWEHLLKEAGPQDYASTNENAVHSLISSNQPITRQPTYKTTKTDSTGVKPVKISFHFSLDFFTDTRTCKHIRGISGIEGDLLLTGDLNRIMGWGRQREQMGTNQQLRLSWHLFSLRAAEHCCRVSVQLVISSTWILCSYVKKAL